MITAKEAAQLTYGRKFDDAVLHSLHLCNKAIQEGTLIGQSWTYAPYYSSQRVVKEVMNELKALGYEVRDHGTLLYISWSYLLK